MMGESKQIIENLELDTTNQKQEVRLKIKDAYINKLREQIVYRDDLLDEARRALKSAGGQSDGINDNRIIDVDNLLYDPFDQRDRSNPRETE